MEGVIRHRTVEANGISIHIAEAGGEDAASASGVILFVHGFPELWYSWRHQMLSLASRGYRCIAPDLRGYGGTTAPASVSEYTVFHLVGDLVGLLDALKLPQVFVVGHDWGAIVSWHLCLFRPDRVTALVNLSVPFMRRSATVKPIQFYKRAYGEDYYICRFQKPGVAEEEFASIDTRLLFKKTLVGRGRGSSALNLQKLRSNDKEIKLPSWLSDEDIEYFASTFERTGFTGGMNYYRCFDLNWELMAPWSGAKVLVPTKFILGDLDLTYHIPGVQNYIHKGGFKRDVPLLEEVVVIKDAAHFIQQERAQEISDHIFAFIQKFKAGRSPSTVSKL